MDIESILNDIETHPIVTAVIAFAVFFLGALLFRGKGTSTPVTTEATTPSPTEAYYNNFNSFPVTNPLVQSGKCADGFHFVGGINPIHQPLGGYPLTDGWCIPDDTTIPTPAPIPRTCPLDMHACGKTEAPNLGCCCNAANMINKGDHCEPITSGTRTCPLDMHACSKTEAPNLGCCCNAANMINKGDHCEPMSANHGGPWGACKDGFHIEPHPSSSPAGSYRTDGGLCVPDGYQSEKANSQGAGTTVRELARKHGKTEHQIKTLNPWIDQLRQSGVIHNDDNIRVEW